MLTTVGSLDPPLGNTRLQVVKLFCALLQCNDARVNRQVADLRTFSTLMVCICTPVLLFTYLTHNKHFLHLMNMVSRMKALFSQTTIHI